MSAEINEALELGKEVIVSSRYIADFKPDMVKLIIITSEKMDNAVLNINGEEYEAFTNLDEPYDYKVHGFFIPRCKMSEQAVLYMAGYGKRTVLLNYPGQKCFVKLDLSESEEASAEEVFEENHSRYKEKSSWDTQITEGLTYRHITCENKRGAPVEMFLLCADTSKIDFELAIAGDGKPYEEKKTDENGVVISKAINYPIATIEKMALQGIDEGMDVKAAVNADFFDMFNDNHPSGFCIKNGEMIVSNDERRPFFGVLKNGKPVISNFEEHPEYRDELKFAVTGSHIMSKDGQPGDFCLIQPFGDVCHPRTAVGICEDGTVLILVVDGRIPDYSNGATLVDLALTLKAFGAKDSINLDGGGSSIMLIRPDGETDFQRQNRPADLQRPGECLIRPCYNGILVCKKQ